MPASGRRRPRSPAAGQRPRSPGWSAHRRTRTSRSRRVRHCFGSRTFLPWASCQGKIARDPGGRFDRSGQNLGILTGGCPRPPWSNNRPSFVKYGGCRLRRTRSRKPQRHLLWSSDATAMLEAKLEAERSKVALSRALARRNMRRRLTAILADQRAAPAPIPAPRAALVALSGGWRVSPVCFESRPPPPHRRFRSLRALRRQGAVNTSYPALRRVSGWWLHLIAALTPPVLAAKRRRARRQHGAPALDFVDD